MKAPKILYFTAESRVCNPSAPSRYLSLQFLVWPIEVAAAAAALYYINPLDGCVASVSVGFSLCTLSPVSPYGFQLQGKTPHDSAHSIAYFEETTLTTMVTR